MNPLPLLALALLAADPSQDDAAKADLDRLQGTWILVSAMRDGKPSTEDDVKRTTIVFTGDRFRFPKEADDATSRRGTIRIDPTKRPRQMDSTSPTGEISPGIYEIAGDDYKVCFAPPGKARPTEFASEPGSGSILQLWKRSKTDAAGADRDKLQGTWTMIVGEREGRKLTDQEVAGARLTVTGITYRYTLGGRTDAGTFRLDPSQTPKVIDVTPDSGKTTLGIYEIEGDTHKVCFAEHGRDRPTEFSTQPESGRSLYVMKRARPTAEAPKDE